MKHLKNILLLGCCLNMVFLFAQHTYNMDRWYVGLGEYTEDSTHLFYNSCLRFSQNGFDTARWGSKKKPYFYRTNTQISRNDSLLLLCSGTAVFNGSGELIADGDKLIQYVNSPGDTNYNFSLFNGALLLPFSNSGTKFHLFHMAWKKFNTIIAGKPINNAASTNLFYNVVDISLNSGQGGFTVLNQPYITDTFDWGKIIAIKHANGRDWWVLLHRWGDNTYYKVLIENDTVRPAIKQKAGGELTTMNILYGDITFNKDGTKIANLYQAGGHNSLTIDPTLDIIDFNRCTGELGRARTVKLPLYNNNIVAGGCFSPNERFIYFTNAYQLFQYDTWQDTTRLIYTVAQPTDIWLGRMKVAPNNKIVMETTNNSKFFHYINHPDSVGTACDFRWKGIRLPSWQGGIPYIPDYNMGALAGSVCDTLTSGIKPEERVHGFRIFPNPAKNNLNMVYLSGDNENLSITVTNILGQVILNNQLLSTWGADALNTSSFTNGIYFIEILQNGQHLETKKFIVEH